LDEHYAELKDAARERLGSLYNPADYPESLQGLFRIDYDFLSVDPPDYLEQLNPEPAELEKYLDWDELDAREFPVAG